MIEFDYRREETHAGRVIYRPVAKVYLQRASRDWIPEYFYVDSGADYTLIPYRMGQFLGFEKNASQVEEIGGVGGVIGARFVHLSMKIEDQQFKATIAWAQIEGVPFLLGREGVFDHFDVTFRQRKKKTQFVC